MSQVELFSAGEFYDPAYENPMVVMVGKGPAGAKCKTCANLTYHEREKRWYKCTLRGFSHGPGTDHRIGYHACSQYKERVE